MVKQIIKIYLEAEDIHKLNLKAVENGFTGRGAISHYIEKVAKEPIVFLDQNIRSLLEVLKLNPKQN